MKKAYFAAGCFWCITPVMKQQNGVAEVYAGYCGGQEENPTYQQVKQQTTSHRETILVEYDETLIDYPQLLKIFLSHVDPYDDQGQFIDRGYSYTLAIYYQNQLEKQMAIQALNELQKQSSQPLAVQLEPLKPFYLAEQEHQNYYLSHPEEFAQELIDSGREDFFKKKN